MRVNVYTEEMTGEVVVVEKGGFRGLRGPALTARGRPRGSAVPAGRGRPPDAGGLRGRGRPHLIQGGGDAMPEPEASRPGYYLLTWDAERREFIRQRGVRAGPYRSLFRMRPALRRLRGMGYDTSRAGGHSVLIERRD
jgi:hypothetical protein